MSVPGKFSFGFKKTLSPAPCSGSLSKAKPQPGLSNAFGIGNEDKDDAVAGGQVGPSSQGTSVAGSSQLSAQCTTCSRNAAPASKASRAQAEAALMTDSSAFDYDLIYDSMKSSQRAAQQSKQEDRSRREAKYVSGMLESQRERNKLLLRAQAKKVQRERDAEGDGFAGGEEFVTDAYREQQEELRKVEEQERFEEERLRKSNKGLSRFYSNLIDEEEEQHRKAVEAAARAPAQSRKADTADEVTGKGPIVSNRDHACLAEAARARGVDVQLNDEGQLVDQRSVLSAGLNVLGRKQNGAEGRGRDGGARNSTASRSLSSKPSARDGAAEARRLQEEARERSSRAIEEQILKLERTKEEEERKRKFTGEKKNTADKVAEAKKRMEERKRRKLEEEQRA